MKELWVEKYRPASIEDYVFKDSTQKNQVMNWIKQKAIPHLFLYGRAGVGKTSLAKVLLKELGTNTYDIMQINASSENSVDDVRNKIFNFVTTMPYGEFKYVILDECDYLSASAQAALRNLMESNSSSARFILTANNQHRVIPALHSRCTALQIDSLDKVEFTTRVAQILVEEDVDIELEVLDFFVDRNYPDMRACINNVQQHVIDGVLCIPEDNVASENTADYMVEMIALFRQKKFKEGRNVICKNILVEEYDEAFKFLYKNLDIWADSDEKECKAIIIIRNAIVKHVSCADPEINLSACLCELELLAKQ